MFKRVKGRFDQKPNLKEAKADFALVNRMITKEEYEHLLSGGARILGHQLYLKVIPIGYRSSISEEVHDLYPGRADEIYRERLLGNG